MSRRRASRTPPLDYGTAYHGNGSRRWPPSPITEARDIITQSKVDRARRRRAARVGFEESESKDHDEELQGVSCLSRRIRESIPPRDFKLPQDCEKYDGLMEPKAWIEDYLQNIVLQNVNKNTAMQCL